MDDITKHIEDIVTGKEKIPRNVTNKLIFTALLYQAQIGEERGNTLDRINVHLTGNGEPKKGLLARTAKIEQALGWLSKLLWLVIGILIPHLIGTYLAAPQ